jgi:hypothetical protein
MKRFLMVVLLIAVAAVMATGCASGGLGMQSVNYSSENSAEVIKKALAENKTIYYKIVYCEMGWLNWNLVLEPMVAPNAVTIEAGEMLTKKVEEILQNKGFIFKRVNNLSPSSSNIQIEFRVSARSVKNIWTGKEGTIGTGSRWFIYYQGDKTLEIYDSQFKMGYDPPKKMIADLALRMVETFLGQ